MEAEFTSLLNGTLAMVSIVLVVGLCMRCGRRTSIHQLHEDEGNDEYQTTIPNPGFRVVRPTHTVPPPMYNQQCTFTSNHLFPTSPQQDPNRRCSFTPANYDDDYVNDKENDYDDKGEGYIEVLPDNIPAISDRMSQQSRLSVNEDYVNVDDQSGQSGQSVDEHSDSENYINMPEQNIHSVIPGISYESVESEDNNSADYVNTSVIEPTKGGNWG